MRCLLLRGREGIEPHGERVELRLPVAAVAVEPQRSLKDRPGIKAAAADPARALLRHQPGTHQHLDVARHRLQRNIERRRQLGDEQVLPIQSVEDRTADRVGKRAEDQIESLVERFWLVHARNLSASRGNSQHFCLLIARALLSPMTLQAGGGQRST
jgi:hypothetical protein